MNKHKRPIKRAIINAVLTALLGVSLAVLGDWNTKQEGFVVKLIVFLILSLSNIGFILFSTAEDSKELSIVSEVSKENSSLKKALSGIILVSQFNSSEINKCIHQYIDGHNINNEVWNYKKACYNLCATIFSIAAEFSGNEDVEVSYVKLNEEVEGEIELYSYKNSTSQMPKLLNKKRNYLSNEVVQYHDMALFVANSSETSVLYGSGDINNHFYRTSEEREKSPNKYNQFIAIPVFCDNEKMIGLLQIACLNKCIFEGSIPYFV